MIYHYKDPYKTTNKMENKKVFFRGSFVRSGLNSHYFHIEERSSTQLRRGLYTHEIRIPIRGGMTIPNIGSLDPGTFDQHQQNDKGRHLPIFFLRSGTLSKKFLLFEKF